MLAGAAASLVHVLVADVVKSFETVDRGNFGSGSILCTLLHRENTSFEVLYLHVCVV